MINTAVTTSTTEQCREEKDSSRHLSCEKGRELTSKTTITTSRTNQLLGNSEGGLEKRERKEEGGGEEREGEGEEREGVGEEREGVGEEMGGGEEREGVGEEREGEGEGEERKERGQNHSHYSGGRSNAKRVRKTILALHVDIIGDSFWEEHPEIIGQSQ